MYTCLNLPESFTVFIGFSGQRLDFWAKYEKVLTFFVSLLLY